MKFEKMLKKDLARVETPAIEKILPGAVISPRTDSAPRAKKRIGAAAIAIILCCCTVLGAAAATAVPLIRKIINDARITANTQQLTVVPEGYVGIYTKEDLLALSETRYWRDRMYILMSDITFTDEDYAPGGICEGGFKPIYPHKVEMDDGKKVHSNLIMFNGNGHVIRNLKFKEGEVIYGLFGGGVNSVINLGIEGCEINAVVSCEPGRIFTPRLYVGAIAGSAEFVGACYVDGLTINVKCDLAGINPDVNIGGSIIVGGIGGHVRYIDSCYVNNAYIKVGGTAAPAKTTSGGINEVSLSIGGVVGEAHSCVTSWFSGQISNTVEGEFFWSGTHDITEEGIGDEFPILMTEEQFAKLMAKVEEKFGKDGFNSKKFKAFYVRKSLDDVAHSETAMAEMKVFFERLNNMAAGQLDLENQHTWYLFDPNASYNEKSKIYEILIEVYNGDKDAIAQLCEEIYIASGVTDCYVLDFSGALNSEDLPGFDFETVWTFRDGKPIQQIFAH